MSPQVLHDSKANSIIEALNDMASSGRNDILLRRIKLDADKIKDKDPSLAFTILGMVACIENDIESVHRYHKNAISYARSKKMPTLQYVVSLLNLDFNNEAQKVLEELYLKNNDDLDVLDQLIKGSAILNRMNEFKSYCDDWKKLTGKESVRLNLKVADENIEMCDVLMNERPEMVVTPDPDLIKLADELVDGIEV